MMWQARVLVVGAGGLGCEVVKDLLLHQTHYIEVVDMDVVEMSNLSRSFVFRQRHIGQPKVLALKEWVLEHFPSHMDRFRVHISKIEHMPLEDLASFHVVAGCLDSLEARRYVNAQLVSLSKQGCLIPYVDGGTEGYQGHASVVIPGHTACIECLAGLFASPRQSIPICSIAGAPRTIEHCILWAANTTDVDPEDLRSLGEVAVLAAAKARQHGIEDHVDVDKVRVTLGHLVITLLSTNAAIAAIMTKQIVSLLAGEKFSGRNWFSFNGQEAVTLASLTIDPAPGCLLDCCCDACIRNS